MRPQRQGAVDVVMRLLHHRPVEVSLPEFVEEFSVDLTVLPYTTCLLGFSPDRECWVLHGFQPWAGHGRDRLDPLVWFCDRIRALLPVKRFWFFFNHWDGWREGAAFSVEYRWVSATDGIGSVDDWLLGPGEIPILSRSRKWVACFGAHRCDPSALLLPEPHFLERAYYRPLFARVRSERRPWRSKSPRAIFAGSDHGPDAGAGNARQMLRAVVRNNALPVDVYLDRRVTRRAQIGYRYILDVDGWVRTWDAWAWKLASGSLVLSRASPWTTFFTEQFKPWEDFVPVAADFSDLGERLEWCREHDAECQRIAARAMEHVTHVYRPKSVGARLATEFGEKLSENCSTVARCQGRD